MPESPLDAAELQAIQAALDTGDVPRAAALLSRLNPTALDAGAIDYLTARLLFARERISHDELLDRLRDIVMTAPDFVEARDLMQKHARGDASTARTEPPPPQSAPNYDTLGNKNMLPASAGRYRSSIPAPKRSPSPPLPQRTSPPLGQSPGNEASGEASAGSSEAPCISGTSSAPPDLAQTVRRFIAECDYSRALSSARRAVERDPNSTAAHASLAWAAIRRAIAGSPHALAEAQSSLARVGSALTDPPRDALAAYVEASAGDAQLAVRLAQRVLRSQPRQAEALAALAQASARLDDEQKATAALETLREALPSLAQSVAAHLRSMGIADASPSSSASVWHALENALSSGATSAALEGLSELAEDQLEARSVGRNPDDPKQLGLSASRFLTRAPIFRQFGPFDFSLSSVERLDASVALLCGSGPRATAPIAPAIWQLCGSYLGETLRQCLGGQWQAAQSSRHTLVVRERTLDPLQVVMARVAHGARGRIPLALSALLSGANDSALRHALRDSIAPPSLWGNRLWPALEELPRLGRALSHSVVDLYTRTAHATALDQSLDSLVGLDGYLRLIRGNNGLSADCASARWVTALAGAYYGEVLKRVGAGEWACDAEEPELGDLEVIFGSTRCQPLHVVSSIIGGSERWLASEARSLLGA